MEVLKKIAVTIRTGLAKLTPSNLLLLCIAVSIAIKDQNYASKGVGIILKKGSKAICL